MKKETRSFIRTKPCSAGRRIHRSPVLHLFVLWAALSLPLCAQTERGQITGIVWDPSGAVIPGAQATLVNLGTGVRSETVTNGAGLYAFPNIPAGKYKAVFSKSGFKTSEQTGVTLSVAQSIRLDVRLEPGSVADTVFVSASLALLRESDARMATLIEGDAVRKLPLSFSGGRQIESFAYTLAPAAEGDSWTSHIAGALSFTKEVLIDGLPATSHIQGNVMESSPSMESIEEFSVQTSGSSAEFGRAGGGVFNFALTQGTNTFHGSAFYYGRNEALNANTWMNNWQRNRNPDEKNYERARDRQSIAGASAGGPLVLPGLYNGKNRTFLFGTFERYTQQQLQIGPLNRTVPIPAFLDGDFSRLLTSTEIGRDALARPVYAGQIFDPDTLRRVGSQWVADPFDGNIIPKQRMSAVSGKIIELYRKSYQPMIPDLLTNNSAGPQSVSPWFHQTQLTIKADHAFSPKLKLTGSLIWTERPRNLLDQGGIWDPKAPEGAGGPLARARKQNVTSRALRLTGSWSPSSNRIHTTSFVYNRYRNPSLSAQADGDWQRYLGLQESTGAGLFPEISFGSAVNGIGTTAIGYGSSNQYIANNYILSDAVNWNRGRHNLKFGGEFWAQQMNSHAGLDVLKFDFASTQTGLPGYSWSDKVGFGFASFFLGEANGGSKNVPFDLYGRRKYLALFFQDDYRITDSFTLNLGLRWEQTQPFHEKYGRWASFNPELKNTALNIAGALEFPSHPQDSFEKQKDWKEFGPRIGAAYRATPKLVLRAAYGLPYIPLGLNYWSGTPYGFAPGYRGTNTQTASPNLPKFNWDNGYPDNYQAPVRDPNALVYGMVAMDERSLFAGYVHQYNAGVQFEPIRDTLVEIAFMGNQGRRLHNGALRRNQPLRAAYEDPKVDPWAWIWDADSAAAAGVRYPYAGFSNYAGVALQPFPHVAAETYGPLYFVGTPKGSSGYKSLQFSLTRRMSKGLAAQISYNLSRAVGNSETGFDETWDEGAGIQDIYSLAASANTVVSYDQTHVFKGYIAFELPMGRNRRFLSNLNPALDAVLGGWEVAGIVRYNSGNPLGVYANVWYPGWEGPVYANYDSTVNLGRQFRSKQFDPAAPNAAGNRYFNPAAFSNPQGHNLGNGKRLYSRLRGFGYAGEDLSLMKTIRASERIHMQVRAEFLNVFNRHYFANPNTNLGDATTFGYVTSTTGNPRIIQFGLRLDW
jgi:hypothetical protein